MLKGDGEEEVVVRRYWLNATQMSIAVTLGFLLAPVVLSMRHIVNHLMR